MGVRYRKSINLGGGFRVNISKSGIGYSWGIPGYRITKTATGKTRKTVSIPGTGISYVTETGGRTTVSQNGNTDETIQVDNSGAQDFQPIEYNELLNRMHQARKMNRQGNIWIVWGIILSIMLIGFVFIFIGIALKIKARKKVTPHLTYSFDSEMHTAYLSFANMMKWNIGKSGEFSRIMSAEIHENVKMHSGAKSTVNTQKVTLGKTYPFFVKADVEPVVLQLSKKKQLIFLPDKLMIIEGKQIGALAYHDISLEVEHQNMIIRTSLPYDAQIVGYTWEKVNKDGSPDKRFSDNKQLPICRYSRIRMASKNGFFVEFQSSNPNTAYDFDKYARIFFDMD